ncbi:Ras-like protein [Histomonas meleagridis]|uniref:Ras-like protein n=1 Tax=Histomonas meleagridis TaxID=135588 RepID=UPI00355AABD2|nr:Ras-like protein [Histomonas meleagridis]KAH0804196.1 Ras-like protein [Histomonas meleagridis]
MKCNVVFFGDKRVGKSSLIRRFVDGIFVQNPVPVIGSNIQDHSIVIDDENVEYKIFDQCGSEEFPTVRKMRIKQGNCYLINYSIENQTSFESVEEYYKYIIEVVGKDVPIIICANKCDLEEERAVSKLSGEGLAKRLGVECIETSALSNINVDDTFITLARMVRKSSK